MQKFPGSTVSPTKLDIVPRTRGFRYRENPDGTFDSICVRCFRTVGSATWEGLLRFAEEQHVCRPSEVLIETETPPVPFN
jgi:hypothetical protein